MSNVFFAGQKDYIEKLNALALAESIVDIPANKSAAEASALSASNSAKSAATKATESASSAANAANQSAIAATAKVDAQSAKTAAETARDAAQLSVGIYATTAAGIAATTTGKYFSVPSPESNEYLILYFNNAGAAVEQKRYPSNSLLDKFGQVFDNSAFTFQGYVSNGIYYENTVYRATDYLLIEGGASYSVTTVSQGSLTNDWYDANKIYISSFPSPNTSAISTVTATAPTHARYLRVSGTAEGAADSRTGAKSVMPMLNIAKVLKIVADNPPITPSRNVTHGTGTVKTKLDGLDVTQAFLLSKQNDLLNELDLLTDTSNPFFMNTWGYTKSGVTPASQVEVTILSRVTAQTFTVGAGKGTDLPGRGGAVVIKDVATGRHYSFGVKANSADSITVFGTLPATLSVCQTMHDAINGQHLSRMGYKGLADYVVDKTQKFSYKKKKPIFVYHAPTSSNPAFGNPDVYKLDNVTKIVDMTVLGGAGNGGYVAGAGLLERSCYQVASDLGVSANPLSTYVSRAYVLQSGVAGDGYEFKFLAYGADGFMEIPLGVVDQSYSKDNITYRTDGRARVQVIGDGVTTLLDQICDVGKEHFLYVNFTAATEITVRVTLADSLPTAIHLHGTYAYQKSPETVNTGYFKNGDVVALLGDSWTQFPVPLSGETSPSRPDGSTGDGMQFLSVRLKERLAADGIAVTTLNMGKSGQTSAWGLYWVNKILQLSPKPTHCIISFYINDYNSIDAAGSGVDTAYDFDPLLMFSNKFQSAGGKKGAVTIDQWYANLQSICSTMLRNGIKPIINMPSHTASDAQTQGIQQRMLNKIAPGFNNFNEDGGRD